ncbi:DUF3422 domain-containing protein [Roseospira marina]|uniref:DUF3422 domain-containing protein n=1 Tax=Roseospira marina TaxID=140057 RepID=A0A5M6I9I1_9PROT|nr:DUF3422 domain-containing protein [Roseospira marina]KAA5604901.1 DUF3422 domain-containing protein [Roseospira marina]MBB4315240.1 putative membrane-anchored protein [Roseospira marina]MBB5088240.1 putative membrane-anchored protein [Roseospira marina]
MSVPPFPEHPQREMLIRELHARPSEPHKAPMRISQITILSGEHGGDSDRAHLARLCSRKGAPPPAEGAKQHVADFGGLTVKWERHTEFSSYAFSRRAHFTMPFEQPVIEEVPQDWLAELPGDVLSAVHVALLPSAVEMPDAEELSLRHFNGNPLIANTVAGGKARVWADFRLHADHFTRILVQDLGLDERHAGRTIQRLIELNTYRALSLLAFPLAQDTLPQLRGIDESLAEVSTRMADTADPATDAELLSRLSQLSADIESLAARTSYRFGATRAYYGLVRQRLRDLRTDRLEGYLTIDGFLDRRMGPAMATCETAETRQEALAQRATRIGSLLRARVEVAVEKQNSDLLTSMNERSRIQLKLQETVEGLSVVAISYYAVGLVSYLFKGVESTGVPLNVGIATGLSVPVVAGLVWYGIHTAKHAVVKRKDTD